MDILANAPAELKPVHGVVTALTAGMEAGQRAVFVEGARRELRDLEAKLGSVGARWALEAVDALVGRVHELEAQLAGATAGSAAAGKPEPPADGGAADGGSGQGSGLPAVNGKVVKARVRG